LDPKNGTAYALRSVIAVVRNEQEEALKLAAEAVRLAPGSATPYVARSYAEQSAFEIDKAHESLEKAAELAPEDALVWARLAEIELSLGDLDAALEAARKAEQLDPGLSRTQTVLGFAYLTRIEVDRAKTAFERALVLDPADPLPRLGLGLARIRDGKIDVGTREIETAASLDPNNSLIRSYLGKAYYEQKRGGLAETEYEQAKLLDPKDPTPWFYSAIHKQTTNRPVEALHDLQKAIDLNDNRAVYRSRLLLDEDLAARGAAVGRIYQELGFEQSALVEAWNALVNDPTDYTAHRLLSDSYSVLPRHETARVSELLQSQLLQPINITPVQPQLAESDLFLLGGLGPSDPSLNEFNSLFLGNRFSLLASGLVGSNKTYGDEVVHSGIWNSLSYSLGQFHYESDGFRSNNDLDTNIYTAFAQYELNPRASVQIELRRHGTEAGDLRELSNPDFLFEDLRQSFDRDTARIGFRLSPGSHSEVLASFAYRELNREENDPSFATFADILNDTPFAPLTPLFPAGLNSNRQRKNDVDSKTVELQYLKRWKRLNIVVGGGFTDQNRTRQSIESHTPTSPFSPDLATVFGPDVARDIIKSLTELDVDREDSEESHLNAYAYSNVSVFDHLALTTGLAVHSIDRDSKQSRKLHLTSTYLSPKVSAVWEPFASTRVRAAWFRAVARPFASGQTIEPTHVAGFNQIFDDNGGTRFQRYGVGVDQEFPLHINGGFEFTWRDVEVPRFKFGDDPETQWISQEETAHRAYLYWTPTQTITLAGQYFYEELERGPSSSLLNGTPLSAVLHHAPVSLGYYHPNGFFTRITTTYVNQDVKVRDDAVASGSSKGSDRFWLTDLSVGYRLPKRFGLFTFGVLNLFDKDFRFQYESPNVVGRIEG
ncbi:MAG: tetratricopeptide repeat protein, partial [Gammaproteobacteria bacterium]